jgi:hypothetical protein
MKTLIILLLFAGATYSQNKSFETDMDAAYSNAKKGIYFALENIPDRKASISKELVDNDKLIAKVKLSKEVRGVKIESEGIFQTYEVKIIIYRSYDKLIQEGYLKNIPEDN